MFFPDEIRVAVSNLNLFGFMNEEGGYSCFQNGVILCHLLDTASTLYYTYYFVIY